MQSPWYTLRQSVGVLAVQHVAADAIPVVHAEAKKNQQNYRKQLEDAIPVVHAEAKIQRSGIRLPVLDAIPVVHAEAECIEGYSTV